jgi:hypothetical protein
LTDPACVDPKKEARRKKQKTKMISRPTITCTEANTKPNTLK